MKEVDSGQYDYEIEMGMLDDIYWLMPKNIFEKVGFYSTDFFLYGEQNDYAMRAVKKGFKLIYTPKARLWHYHHLTTASGSSSSKKVIYWQSYSTMVLALKHLSWFYFLRIYVKFSSRLLLNYLMIIFIKKEKGNRGIIVARLKGVFYFTLWAFNRKPNMGFNPYNEN